MKARDVEQLKELTKRVERNVPNHRDPEHFHVEKSDVVHGLRQIIKRNGGEQND